MPPSLAQACSVSLQTYSPSTQGKAVAAKANDLNWNGEEKILLPTIGVLTELPWRRVLRRHHRRHAQLHLVCEKIMLVQYDNGDCTNRKHARLKDKIDDRGVDTFRSKAKELLGEKFEEAEPFQVCEQY